jgi:hypothetical protein
MHWKKPEGERGGGGGRLVDCIFRSQSPIHKFGQNVLKREVYYLFIAVLKFLPTDTLFFKKEEYSFFDTHYLTPHPLSPNHSLPTATVKLHV